MNNIKKRVAKSNSGKAIRRALKNQAIETATNSIIKGGCWKGGE